MDKKHYNELVMLSQKIYDQASDTLVDALNSKIRPEADRILNTWGGIQTQEQFNEYHQCAKDILQLLMEEIPGLLRNEEFFSKTIFK